jgi:galactose-1-phosphate uridylyltransferase
MNKPHSKYLHVYAIVRFDSYVSDMEDAATVVKVFASKVEAEKVAIRLREVNKEKRCIYTVQITRSVDTSLVS